jgi:hypothetical protein
MTCLIPGQKSCHRLTVFKLMSSLPTVDAEVVVVSLGTPHSRPLLQHRIRFIAVFIAMEPEECETNESSCQPINRVVSTVSKMFFSPPVLRSCGRVVRSLFVFLFVILLSLDLRWRLASHEAGSEDGAARPHDSRDEIYWVLEIGQNLDRVKVKKTQSDVHIIQVALLAYLGCQCDEFLRVVRLEPIHGGLCKGDIIAIFEDLYQCLKAPLIWWCIDVSERCHWQIA